MTAKLATHQTAEYFARLPDQHRTIFESYRDQLQALLPGAALQISYQIPCFKRAGKFVIGISAWQNHFSLHGMSNTLKDALPGLLQRGKLVGSTVQFKWDNPPEVSELQAIVRARLQEMGQAVD